jgi:hypothetical protein
LPSSSASSAPRAAKTNQPSLYPLFTADIRHRSSHTLLKIRLSPEWRLLKLYSGQIVFTFPYRTGDIQVPKCVRTHVQCKEVFDQQLFAVRVAGFMRTGPMEVSIRRIESKVIQFRVHPKGIFNLASGIDLGAYESIQFCDQRQTSGALECSEEINDAQRVSRNGSPMLHPGSTTFRMGDDPTDPGVQELPVSETGTVPSSARRF